MRSAPDAGNSPSATPIYDALYAEYQRSFRALPGDRSGEEDLGFTAFRPAQSYAALPGRPTAGGGSPSVWQRQDVSGLRRLPAALPPAPRRGA